MLQVESVGKIFPRPSGLQRLLIKTAAAEPVEALRDVELHVERGEVVGLVGPNGAGKTTLLRIIATLLDPTTGYVRIDGSDTVVNPSAVRSRIGLVLADDRALYWRLDGRQNLEFFARMAGLPRPEAVQRSAELLERVGLAHRDKLVFGYSSGMRARLSIARALLGRPPMLVLDEATRALDPLAQRPSPGSYARWSRAGSLSSCQATGWTRSRQSAIVWSCWSAGRCASRVGPARLAGSARFADAMHAILRDDASDQATP
ncbi:MAG: ABC transporter ATP-binding protein [Ilumatobacteraceae bacterium]